MSLTNIAKSFLYENMLHKSEKWVMFLKLKAYHLWHIFTGIRMIIKK